MANLTRRDQLALERRRAIRKKGLQNLKLAGVSGAIGVVVHWLPLVGFLGWPFILIAIFFGYLGVMKIVRPEKKKDEDG